MTSSRRERKGALALRPALARLVALKRLLAQTVLILEQLLPRLLPLVSTVALFAAVSWFGLFRIAPDPLRLAILAAFALALSVSLYRLGGMRWPSVAEADHLLEERNGLKHQPVAIQEDELALDTPIARALWHEHQNRMAARIANLDAGLPRPDIALYDRFALRVVPALLLVTAFSFSASNNGGTLSDAFQRSARHSADPDVRIDAWVTPPYYTGEPPIYLNGSAAADGAAKPVNVPQFSELTVRITGAKIDEKVLFRTTGSDQDIEIAAQQADDGKEAASAVGKKTATAAPSQQSTEPSATAKSETAAARTHVLKMEKGGTLTVNGQSWSFNVLADKPPEIAFDGIPRATVNGALEIGFKAKDDYGVEEAHAEFAPVDADPTAQPLYAPPEYKLEIPPRHRRDAKGLASHDLTKDPLAGKRVRVTLVAKDGAGQIGRSPPYEMVMPSRNFSEPLAAAVAEERQVFALDRRKMPDAIALNESLTIRPDETIPNLTHYLLLESGLTRMKLARDEAALKDTADYLWQMALGMEDAQLTDAQKKLREAQEKLSDALQHNAPDAEIKKLMDELRKATDAYLKELAERMQNMPTQPNQKSANILRQQDLQRLMDQIENLARSGNRDAAQQMLSELQRLMNNLQAGRPQQGQNQAQENSEMRQQMDKLGQIMRDQQKLMEQTFQLDQAMRDRMQHLGDPDVETPLNQPMPDFDGSPQRPQDQQPPSGKKQAQSPTDGMTADQLRDALKQLRKQQDDLAKQLGELQNNLGALGMKPNPGFGKAEREMKGAAGELGQGRGDTAVQGQGRALEALRQGTRDMMSQMMQAQQGQGQQGQLGQGNQNGRDPLGRQREQEGQISDDGPKIPNEIDMQRAREILDAIRERLSNNPSQAEERKYLERLLDLQ
jgi:uncharacterized protein (TIGR02302 family)